MEKTFTEKEIRDIAKDEYMKNYRAGNPFVPPHQHDGNDNVQIQAKYVIPNNKLGTFLIASQSATDPVTSTISLSHSIFNPSTLYFYGIGRYPVSGTATVKASISAMAQLGNCFATSSTLSLPDENDVIYANASSTFTNSGGSWVPTVNGDSDHFISIYDSSFNLVASIDILRWTSTSITFTSTVTTGWSVSGNLIIT